MDAQFFPIDWFFELLDSPIPKNQGECSKFNTINFAEIGLKSNRFWLLSKIVNELPEHLMPRIRLCKMFFLQRMKCIHCLELG